MMSNELVLDGGKYRIENDNGVLTIYRYDQLWDARSGDKLMLSMLHHIDMLSADNAELMEVNDNLLTDNAQKTILLRNATADNERLKGVLEDIRNECLDDITLGYHDWIVGKIDKELGVKI